MRAIAMPALDSGQTLTLQTRILLDGQEVQGTASVRRGLSTDLPAAIRGSVGLGEAATADLELPAASGSPLGVWSPWSAGQRASHVGRSVKILAGYDDVLVPVFTGRVEDDQSASSSGVLSLSCIDSYTTLDKPVTVPAVGSLRGALGAPMRPGLSPTWVVDWVLRDCGWYATPPIAEGCVLSATLQGSMWPERGALLASQRGPNNNQVPRFGPTSWGSAPVEALARYEMTRAFWTGATMRVDLIADAGTGTTNSEVATIRLIPGGPRIVLYGGLVRVFDFGTGRSASYVPGETISIEFAPLGGNEYRLSFLHRGTSYTQTYAGPTTSAEVEVQTVWHPTRRTTRIGALQVYRGAPAGPPLDFTPTAKLTQLRNTLVATTGERATGREIIRGICEAERAVLAFDEDGIPVLRSREDMIGARATAHVLHSRDRLGEHGWGSDVGQLRAAVQTTAWRPSVRTSNEINLPAWRSESVIEVPANGTVVTDVDLVGAVVNLDLTVDFGSWRGIGSHYEARRDPMSTRAEPLAVVRVELTSPTTARVTLVNTRGYPLYVADSAGEPCLVLAASAIISQDEQQVYRSRVVNADVPVEHHVWDELEVPENRWLQSPGDAISLAMSLAADTATPLPVLSQVEVLYDPRVQLGDLVRLQSPGVTDLDLYANVTAIDSDLTSAAPRMLLTVRPRAITWSDLTAALAGRTYTQMTAAYAGLTYAQMSADPLTPIGA